MAKVKIQGHASGTGVLTVTAPNTSTDRTITLPDATGTLLNSDGDGSSLTGVGVDGISSSADATAMTITSAERIGIGDTTPEAKLEVHAGSETGLTVKATVSGEYGAIIQSASTNTTPIADFRSNGGTSRLKVMSDGRARSPFTAGSWCNVQMSSGAFNDHHNHDSLTDVGTGAFVLSFTVNMNDSTYSVVSSNPDGYISGYTNLAQDSFRGYNYDTNGTKVDVSQVCFAVFGN